jgi:AcrR family transcriptional regulator
MVKRDRQEPWPRVRYRRDRYDTDLSRVVTVVETARRPGRPRSQEADGAILGAALDLFTERGAAEISIEQIAQRAGVTRATVYRRFANKTELLVRAIETAGSNHGPHAMGWSGVDEMLTECASYLCQLRNRRMLRRLLGAADDYPELIRAHQSAHGRRRSAAMRATLQRACDAEEFPSGTDVKILQQVLNGAVHHHVDAYSDNSSAGDIKAYLVGVLRQIGYRPTPPGQDTARSSHRAGGPRPGTVTRPAQ